MNTVEIPTRRIRGEPAWEVAYLFPDQGKWSDEDFLALSTNRLVELSDGFIEVLPVPTTSHQFIMLALYRALLAFVDPRNLGLLLVSGIRVRLRKGKFRDPDVVFMLTEHTSRVREEYWIGADLVVEVVSGGPKDRKRDLVVKPAEYARAGIPEYWVVDPQEEKIKVLRLRGRKYVTHGVFLRGQKARSHLLKGFEVEVDAVLTKS